jgi:hypothetical protein
MRSGSQGVLGKTLQVNRNQCPLAWITTRLQ